MQYLKTNQLGKKKKTRTQINKKANVELKKLWIKKKIFNCELCGSTYFLTNAHKHKRVWFYDKPDHYLWNYNLVLLLCIHCHNDIEYNKIKTIDIFEKLRP